MKLFESDYINLSCIHNTQDCNNLIKSADSKYGTPTTRVVDPDPVVLGWIRTFKNM